MSESSKLGESAINGREITQSSYGYSMRISTIEYYHSAQYRGIR